MSLGHKRRNTYCCRLHINSLWSVWYGLSATAFQVYLTEVSAQRLLSLAHLPWPNAPPQLELYLSAVLIGIAALLLPFFLLAAILKVGNLANDGFKLGSNLSTCTADPPSVLTRNNERGTLGNLWRHCGPTSCLLHLTAAFCLLIPRLLMEAKLIEAGFLSKEAIWRTDLDLVVEHRDRMVVLNFFTENTSSVSSPEPVLSVPEQLSSYDKQLDTVLSTLSTETNMTVRSMSLEFGNYAAALLLYSIRYPAVFWNTNKSFGIIFSLQLLSNALHALMSYAGVSVLYKIQVVGAMEILPSLKRTHSLGSPFLLDAYVTLALFVLSSVLVLSSSLVLYLYGIGRFYSFLQSERDRRVVIVRGEESSGNWNYLIHCCALSLLVSLTVTLAPLLHDFTVIYKSSLDGAVLATVFADIIYLFVWVAVWLLLTLKQRWIFHLRVTVGRATVRSARSVKLLTDVELVANSSDSGAPLLVVGCGRTYAVRELSPKKAIMSVIQKNALDRKAKIATQGETNLDDDNDIYWLRPKPSSSVPCSPPDKSSSKWQNKSNSSHKMKVTFDDAASKQASKESSSIDFEDDGDYATLRMGNASNLAREDTVSEDIKVLERVQQDETVTFVRSREPQPDYEDPSPLPDSKGGTPRCLRRADSGMHDVLTPRSGSVSSGSGASGSSPPGAHSSESSGVHSGGSSRKATSVEDIPGAIDKPQWRSCSLQRNIPPPGAPGFGHLYSFGTPLIPEQITTAVAGMPAVILEHPGDNTVVIRRKGPRPRTTELPNGSAVLEEPFGRSTNMRLTSFMDDAGSHHNNPYPCNTMPHLPAQVQSINTQQCNTMPHLSTATPFPPLQPQQQQPRPHTTIPTHMNGVRLFPSAPISAPYAKRLQPRLPRPERDSANFSLTSSGDSDGLS